MEKEVFEAVVDDTTDVIKTRESLKDSINQLLDRAQLYSEWLEAELENIDTTHDITLLKRSHEVLYSTLEDMKYQSDFDKPLDPNDL